jgi:hypothetical protein
LAQSAKEKQPVQLSSYNCAGS